MRALITEIALLTAAPLMFGARLEPHDGAPQHQLGASSMVMIRSFPR